ncbi:MAG TPA: fibronectin type III domain-containing protein [Candidatus Binatia bacterium]|nr:fibronectin type III domain-containing protein [Candidatus Binatia bacterium]
MRGGMWWMAAGGILLTALTANAAPYAARVRWQPSPDGDIAGYRVYQQTGSGALQSVLDAGLPTLASDGTLAAIVVGLSPCVSYDFAVTAYRADRTESVPSNEVALTLLDCSDGNACNGVETCVAGVCVPGVPLNCDDGNACTTDSCDPAGGCVHVAVAGCTACASAADCNDGNACTTDACVAGRCTHTTLADGTSCDDGRYCDGVETCRAGVCTSGTPVQCDDGNPCTADACDETHRTCTHVAVAGCVPCTSAAQCDDANACTADACTAGRCTHTARPDGTSCDDGLFCDGVETCRSGVCTMGPPVNCDDGNACTVDTCDEGRHACTHTGVAGCCTVDADCAVTDLCQTNPRCTANRCTSDAVVCPDPGQCATASCDPAHGCQTTPVPDGTPCDDGNVCTTNDVCTAGTCGTGPAALTIASTTTDGGTTHLSTRTTARGTSLSARTWFAAPDGFDVATSDVQITFQDDGGDVHFATAVPGAAFTASGNRAVYMEDDRATGGGFTRIELRARGGRVTMAVRAVVASSTVAAPGIDELRAASSTSSTIDWKVRTGFQCVGGSGQCQGNGRRCR